MNPTQDSPARTPRVLKGTHPGPPLKTEPGVFRCELKPVTKKKKPDWADYAGVLELAAGAKAQVLAWIHEDASIGLRVELIKGKTKP